jgi:hypothetical protein
VDDGPKIPNPADSAEALMQALYKYEFELMKFVRVPGASVEGLHEARKGFAKAILGVAFAAIKTAEQIKLDIAIGK